MLNDLANMRGIFHLHMTPLLLMIIYKIDIRDFTILEPEDDPPIAGQGETPETTQISSGCKRHPGNSAISETLDA